MSAASTLSPFVIAGGRPLDCAKFRDPEFTATGERRARVRLEQLETLWFNTGTLCNLACLNCYIESSPRNDALIYLQAAEVSEFLDELAVVAPGPREIGFTGGEPFLNRELIAMLTDSLARGHEVLVLTNAMRPMRRSEAALLNLRLRYGARLKLRVSLDHHTAAVHDAERGPATFQKSLEGLRWLLRNDFSATIAARRIAGEGEAHARAGFAELIRNHGLALDAGDPANLVLFPEMDAGHDVPEITEACWSILDKSPSALMCASSRMVIHRKGEPRATVAACTLLPYAEGFDFGPTLEGSFGEVALNHPHCATFCVLGGASCSVS